MAILNVQELFRQAEWQRRDRSQRLELRQRLDEGTVGWPTTVSCCRCPGVVIDLGSIDSADRVWAIIEDAQKRRWCLKCASQYLGDCTVCETPVFVGGHAVIDLFDQSHRRFFPSTYWCPHHFATAPVGAAGTAFDEWRRCRLVEALDGCALELAVRLPSAAGMGTNTVDELIRVAQAATRP